MVCGGHARCTTADGYHDNEGRGSRSGEVGPSQFISLCAFVWLHLVLGKSPNVFGEPFQLAICIYKKGGALDVEKSDEMAMLSSTIFFQIF